MDFCIIDGPDIGENPVISTVMYLVRLLIIR